MLQYLETTVLDTRELQNNELPLYNWFSCKVDIEHDAGQVAVCNAVIKPAEQWRSTTNGMQYNHAVTLLISVNQKLCLVPINTNKNHFIRRNRTPNQLVGVTSRKNLHSQSLISSNCTHVLKLAV